MQATIRLGASLREKETLMPKFVIEREMPGASSLSEAEIRAAMRFLYARAKLACEPAGAASTAALLAGKVPLEQGETVVAVVSGGNVATDTAVAILAGR